MSDATTLGKSAVRFFGALAYLEFLIAFAWFALFLLDLGPLGIDQRSPRWQNHTISQLAVDLALILIFGLHHSVAARPRIKTWIERLFSIQLERSVYAFASSTLLIAICVFWQPLPGILWNIELPLARALIFSFFALGLIFAVWSTFLIDHAALVGLRQSGWCKSAQDQGHEFRQPALYRYVRHPMQLGILILLWATPHMSTGHALLSAAVTAYIFIGLYFEERALMHSFGSTYAEYRRRVGKLLPRIWKLSKP